MLPYVAAAAAAAVDVYALRLGGVEGGETSSELAGVVIRGLSGSRVDVAGAAAVAGARETEARLLLLGLMVLSPMDRKVFNIRSCSAAMLRDVELEGSGKA